MPFLVPLAQPFELDPAAGASVPAAWVPRAPPREVEDLSSRRQERGWLYDVGSGSVVVGAWQTRDFLPH